MSTPNSLYYPEGFFFQDLESVQAKVGAIALGGPDQLQVVLDFDRTMTTNGAKDLTSWDIVSTLLPPEAQAEDRRDWLEYQPKEFDHTLTIAEAEVWWTRTLQRYVDNNVSLHDIEDAAESVRLRDGVVTLFRSCEEANVHSTILSAGLLDVIRVVNKRYNIHPSHVASTPLMGDQHGIITDWDHDKMVHILNKKIMGNSHLSEVAAQRPNVLLVGDAIEDTDMVDGDENVIRIRQGDSHKIPHGRVDKYLEESYEAGYDLVRLGDFGPIVDLAAWVIRQGGLAVPTGTEA